MTIKTFIVLSAPSTASSLIAECLNTKMFMGTNFADNGHFEHPTMLKLSQDILAHASRIDKIGPLFNDYTARHKNDPWDNPPSEQAILACKDIFEQRIINIIKKEHNSAVHCSPKKVHNTVGNSAKCWGWKDGRIGWVIPIIAPYLENPHYIILHREYEQTAQAITRRMAAQHPIGIDRARILVKTMYKRIFKFMATL